ncbi:MAG: topoisomerase DNA-binding C4 zinc finger domain-containing protein [Anaerobiospirillum succiniciproducens]|uniref:DNA topoisomerase family protein n=1 Tax=Anaerobiospirillum succiniciproducens TaxID=13335 RepID=UPI0026DAA487|nr:topoisomerase DNA-binding C4 zinc finger domain-containing protein [Anaerobiospirillum succiniciproducens]MDO4676321.1 topoisomerase DNA-binding C4 zinc finger domain-containing protein [Anaerobiospirillum succiniciproducens]
MLQNDNLTTNAHIKTTESLVDISTYETDNGKSPSSMPTLEQNGSTSSTHVDEHNSKLHVNASTPILTKDENQQAPDALEDMLKRNLATAVVVTADIKDEQTTTIEESESSAPVNSVEQSGSGAQVSAIEDSESLASGSAVQILNKMIEVVEDEEASSSDETKIVHDNGQNLSAKAQQDTSLEDGIADGDKEAKPDLTIAEPVAIIESGIADADNEASYPELSAADQERYNKMLLKEGDPCPACGQGSLILRQNERVAFLGCSCFPKCKLRYYTARSNAVVTLKTLESTCPECGARLAVKKGRYGLFIGCSDYPQCTYTYKEDSVDEEISCPSCNKGQLERRRARSGRIFFGCNYYPSCEFILPGVPVASECKECGFPLKYKKKVKAGIALICGNPLCASRRRRKQEMLAQTPQA